MICHQNLNTAYHSKTKQKLRFWTVSRRYIISQNKAVRSDNGSEFINKKFKDYTEKNGIKQTLSEVSKPQSNDKIERANATIEVLNEKSIEMDENLIGFKN